MFSSNWWVTGLTNQINLADLTNFICHLSALSIKSEIRILWWLILWSGEGHICGFDALFTNSLTKQVSLNFSFRPVTWIWPSTIPDKMARSRCMLDLSLKSDRHSISLIRLMSGLNFFLIWHISIYKFFCHSDMSNLTYTHFFLD